MPASDTDREYKQFREAVEALDRAYGDNAEKMEAAIKKAEKEREDLIASARKEFDEHLEAMKERLRQVKLITPADKPPPTRRAAYSDRASLLMAKLCKLAYERYDKGESYRLILRDKLAFGGFTLVDSFSAGPTQGFVAYNDTISVLAFRGTTTVEDWKINLDAKREIIKNHPRNVRAHRGFLRAYAHAEPRILELMRDLPDRPFYITGHSLGGALAVIASAALPLEPDVKSDNISAVYTFGAPRVGGGDFTQIVKVPHYRVFNPWDIVPSVPPVWASFQHTGDMRFLARDDRAPLIRKQMLGGMLTFDLARNAWLLLRRSNRTAVQQHDIMKYIVKLQSISDARNKA
jgi:triacylglycerol lipase